MCLGVPGRILGIEAAPDGGAAMGRVSFGGITREVCLTYVPDARVGDYVVVHVGFAISRIDEAEALMVFEYLASIRELDELGIPPAVPDGETAGGT
jgi:hydrogenase expression/formation protein HypC